MQGTTRGIELSRLLTDGVTGVELTTSGIDLTFDYMTGLLGGELNIEAQGSFVMDNAFEDFIFRNLQLQPSYQANGFTNYFRNPLTISPFRGIGWVTFNISGFNVRYQGLYVAGVDDDRCIGIAPRFAKNFGPTNFGREVGSFIQHDLHFQFDLPFTAVKAQLEFPIENIADADPSAARLEQSYDTFIGNPFGRVFRVKTRSQF